MNEKLSNSALKVLHKRWKTDGDRHAYELLWLSGDKMVKKIVNKFLQQGILQPLEAEDAVQEGRLAVGMSLDKWEPDRGAYSTYVWTVIRNTLTDFAKQTVSGKIDSGVDDLLDEEYLAETVAMEEQILALLGESHIAYQYWVLGYTQEELAEEHGMSQTAVSRTLEERRLVVEDLLAWGASVLSSDNRP